MTSRVDYKGLLWTILLSSHDLLGRCFQMQFRRQLTRGGSERLDSCIHDSRCIPIWRLSFNGRSLFVELAFSVYAPARVLWSTGASASDSRFPCYHMDVLRYRIESIPLNTARPMSFIEQLQWGKYCRWQGSIIGHAFWVVRTVIWDTPFTQSMTWSWLGHVTDLSRQHHALETRKTGLSIKELLESLSYA